MTGGLVFGAPAWTPERIETTFSAGVPEKGAEPAPASETPSPTDRDGLLNLLDKIHLGCDHADGAGTCGSDSRACSGGRRPGREGADSFAFAVAAGICSGTGAFAAGDGRIDCGNAALACGSKTRANADRAGPAGSADAKIMEACDPRRGIKKTNPHAPLLNRYPHGHPSIFVPVAFGIAVAGRGAAQRGGRCAGGSGERLGAGEIFAER